VATYGGPVRKQSNGSTSSGSSHRDSTSLSARLASLAPIPLGSTVAVSSPPTSALPPIPFPEPPTFAPPGIPTLAREQQQQEEESGEDEAIPFPEPPTFSPHALPTQTCEEEVPELCTEDKDNEDEDEDDKLHALSASFEMILEEEEDTELESADGNDILAAIEKTETQKAIIPLDELKLSDKEE